MLPISEAAGNALKVAEWAERWPQDYWEAKSRAEKSLISHRFSSVRMADRILVLADGKVEAAGTHEELVAQGGSYSELFELQAAGYR